VTRALSFASGLLMVAAGALRGDRPALAASAVGTVAVIVGLRFVGAATLAVVATVVSLALSDPSAVLAAVAGLAAACYLVLRRTGGATAITTPTVVGAVGLSVIAVLGTLMPSTIPWVPLAAPVAVLLTYVTVVAALIS
jgi:hypothetical protein